MSIVLKKTYVSNSLEWLPNLMR